MAIERQRLLSLDVLRGLTVLGMILVNSAAGMFYGAEAAVFPTLLHAHWIGLSLADIVFPAFLMMVGVSIPMSLAQARDGEGSAGAARRRIGARTLRLVLIGFLLSNIYWFANFESGDWRLFGVLQRIGLVYGACAILYLALGGRLRLALVVSVLLLYWPLTMLPSLDGLAFDISQRGHNFVASVDRALLGGGHIYVTGPAGYDPEGLLGTIPAIAHGLIGVAAGEYLLSHRGGRAAAPLGITGALMIAIGLAWGAIFPIIKDIWSSSFVLVTCGITLLCLALLHAWVDRPRDCGRRLSWPLLVPLAFGVNAIAAYVLHMLTAGMIGWDLLLAPYHAARTAMPEELASLTPILLYIGLIWLCMEWLRRRQWIIKV